MLPKNWCYCCARRRSSLVISLRKKDLSRLSTSKMLLWKRSRSRRTRAAVALAQRPQAAARNTNVWSNSFPVEMDPIPHSRFFELRRRQFQLSKLFFLQRSEKRSSGRKNRGRSAGEDDSMGADCKQPRAPEPEAADSSEAGRGKTMSFLRSRLYKARSLGCLVKERILVEASHCQYEIWKRFGRKGGIVGMVNPSDVNMNGPTLSPTPAKISSVTCSSSTECSTSLAVVHNVTQHCTSCWNLVVIITSPLPQIPPAILFMKTNKKFICVWKLSTRKGKIGFLLFVYLRNKKNKTKKLSRTFLSCFDV